MSVFDEPLFVGERPLIPVVCRIDELLAGSTLEYLILDVHGPESGVQAIRTILRACPGLRIIVFGPQGIPDLALEAISAGARAYLDLNSEIDTVRQALNVVVSGNIWGPHRLLSKLVDQLLKISGSYVTATSAQLTAREMQVAELILTARSNGEIARKLGIGTQTVTAHVGRMMRKTRTANRIGLAAFMRTSPIAASVSGSQGMR
jgi:DNA-binding NarL/FixJ family response regulator